MDLKKEVEWVVKIHKMLVLRSLELGYCLYLYDTQEVYVLNPNTELGEFCGKVHVFAFGFVSFVAKV